MWLIAQQPNASQTWSLFSADSKNIDALLPGKVSGYMPKLPRKILMNKQHFHVHFLIIPGLY